MHDGAQPCERPRRAPKEDGNGISRSKGLPVRIHLSTVSAVRVRRDTAGVEGIPSALSGRLRSVSRGVPRCMSSPVPVLSYR
jgi:hypothetical protein